MRTQSAAIKSGTRGSSMPPVAHPKNNVDSPSIQYPLSFSWMTLLFPSISPPFFLLFSLLTIGDNSQYFCSLSFSRAMGQRGFFIFHCLRSFVWPPFRASDKYCIKMNVLNSFSFDPIAQPFSSTLASHLLPSHIP